MKRTLALTLALVLALGLCVPALAAEPDGTYYVDGQPVETYPVEETPPMDEDTVCLDFYEEYAQEHPEEIANLDTDALIAGWGYTDINMTAEEAFMERFSWANVTLEDAVKIQYINNRVRIEELRKDAADYKEQYPEAWAAFDADAFFEEGSSSDAYYAYWAGMTKAEYMAEWNILTDEEFADDMFVQGAWADEYEKWDDDGWYDPDGEPTLTLMVNGVASEIAIEAGEGTTYADAAALRSILGDQAVAPDATGSIAIRAAAEAAGWDVQWYDGGWADEDQEVQLWDRKSFETQLVEKFGPLNDFMAKAMDLSMETLTSKEAISGKETVDVTLTRFSTLDGNKDYKLKLTADYVIQNSVLDMTLTFDVAQLLGLVSPADLANLGKDGAPTLETLTQLLKAGKMEILFDYDKGAIAYNIPLLTLLDESQEGWHTYYLPGWQEMEDAWQTEGNAYTSSLYSQMIAYASWGGAEYALADYQRSVAALSSYAGKDCFTTADDGSMTYNVTTQRMNRALAELMELSEPEKVSLFKAFDWSYALDNRGKVDMKIHIRPDMEGIAQAMAREDFDPYFGQGTIMMGVLGVLDMDMAASGGGDQSRSTSQLTIHWNNVGTMDMRCEAKATPTTRAPRQIKDVEPLAVEPTPGTILTNAS